MSLPPDVLFAQKASAVVKAAGMDPRQLDLEAFRLKASEIFVLAYQAIYGEQFPSLNGIATDELQMAYTKLVIQGLYEKTRNKALMDINSIDVVQGNHRALGVLVGILFAEGQRLWLEKVGGGNNDVTSSEIKTSPFRNGNKSNKHRKVKVSTKESGSYSPQHVRMKLTKDVYVKDPNAQMKDIPFFPKTGSNRIANRINYLKSNLDNKDSTNESPKSPPVDGHNEAWVESEDNNISSDSGTKKKKRKKKKKISKKTGDDGADNEPKENPSSPSESDRVLQDMTEIENKDDMITENDNIKSAETKNNTKKRPTSAPATRRRVTSPSSRLYQPRVVDDSAVAKEIIIPTKPTVKKIVDDDKYTYDMKSGRRILISQDELNRKNNKLELGDDIADAINNSPTRTKSDSNSFNVVQPTRPHWPGSSTEGSVDEWLKKQKELKDREHNISAPTLAQPKYYHSYSKLEPRDLIISIEHCHNCNHHNIHTRHDANGYITHADQMLRALAQVAHESCISTRIGVIRFKANVTPKSKQSDVNNRIGAFEIQVAYKGTNGQVTPEILHSKLITRRWPSKSVLEKRFKSYISKLRIPTYSSEEKDSGTYKETGAEGLGEYPIGVGSWSETPLADASWSYPAHLIIQAAPPATKDSDATTAANDDTNDAGQSDDNGDDVVNIGNNKALVNVQWVFDSRNVTSTQHPFPIGSNVRVKNVVHPRSSVERKQLLAVVKGYPGSTTLQDTVHIQLKYHSEGLDVHVSDLNDDDHTSSSLPPKSVPTELEALILLASKQYKEFPWKVMDSDDKVKTESNEYFLSRTSYFHQIRNLVYDIEVKMNGVSGAVKHPKTGKMVDLQAVYSEECLDWVFNKYGKLADMSSLEKMIVPPVIVAPVVVASPTPVVVVSPTPVIVVPVTPVVTVPSPTVTKANNTTNLESKNEKKVSPKAVAAPTVTNNKDAISKIKSELFEAENEGKDREVTVPAVNAAPKSVERLNHESPVKNNKSSAPSSPGDEYGGDFEEEEDDQPSVGAKTLDEKQVDNLSNYFADLLNDDDDTELPADFYFA